MGTRTIAICAALGLAVGCADQDDTEPSSADLLNRDGSHAAEDSEEASGSSASGGSGSASGSSSSAASGGNSASPIAGGGATECTAVGLAPDGKCNPPPDRGPCTPVDPDCAVAPPDAGAVACARIRKLPDGQCDPRDPCGPVQDPDCQGIVVPPTPPGDGCSTPPSPPQDGGVACILIAYPTNGICEAAPGCEHTDPEDCSGNSCSFGDASFPPGTSIVCPDGCNSCGCGPDGWSSTLVACGPLPQIERCDGPAEDEVSAVEPLYLATEPPWSAGHALALEITYGGGCEEHPLRLCFDGSFDESLPVQTRIWVVDDGEPDPCRALVTVQQVFDLSPLADYYRQAYQTEHGEITVHAKDGSVSYRF